MNHGKLAIIAGGGHLPQQVLQACQAQHRSVCVVVLEGQADPKDFLGVPHTVLRLGAVGKALKFMREEEVASAVFCGTVRRPGWKMLRPDRIACKWLFALGKKAWGDDGILRGVLQGFESEGFQVLAVQDLVPELLAQEGLYTNVAPSEADLQDIQRGMEVAKALGSVDVGQAVIVEKGLVLSLEGIEGTAALITRTQSLKREQKAGVLVKAFKPQQERRVDVPSIGVQTIEQIHGCGLSGVAIEAGGALIIDGEQTIKRANQLGVFMLGVTYNDKHV